MGKKVEVLLRDHVAGLGRCGAQTRQEALCGFTALSLEGPLVVDQGVG